MIPQKAETLDSHVDEELRAADALLPSARL
jgi:hypothetical protein